MSNKKAKLYARILAIVLSVLMVAGMAYYTIYMIVENARAEKEEEKKEANAQELPYTFSV